MCFVEIDFGEIHIHHADHPERHQTRSSAARKKTGNFLGHTVYAFHSSLARSHRVQFAFFHPTARGYAHTHTNPVMIAGNDLNTLPYQSVSRIARYQQIGRSQTVNARSHSLARPLSKIIVSVGKG